MKGIVEQVSNETSKKGDEYLRIKIDGVTYSVWDKLHMDPLKEGDQVEFEYKESGQWKNIVEMRNLSDDSTADHDRDDYTQRRDRQIARMSCVKSAAYVLASTDLSAEDRGDHVLSVARAFERYLYEDDRGVAAEPAPQTELERTD